MKLLSKFRIVALLVGLSCLVGCASPSGAPDVASSSAEETASTTQAQAGAHAPQDVESDAVNEESVGQDANASTSQNEGAEFSPDKEGNVSSRTALSAVVVLDGTSFDVELADNDTAAAFAQMLPLQVEMSELNGNEKYVYLDESLPAHPANPGTIEAGDVMLYGDNCLVVFYESHATSYSYTRIGAIADAAGLAAAVGSGSVSASFSLG